MAADNIQDYKGLEPKEILLDTKQKDPKFWASRIYDLLNHEIDLQRYNRAEMQKDYRMYEGGEMPHDELAQQNPKYSDLRTNFMRIAANYIISAVQNMEIVGKIYPAEGNFVPDEFRRLADAYNKRLTSIRQHVDWKGKWDRAIADAIICGESYLKEGLQLTENGDRLEFYLKNVDYRNVWVDHMSSDPGLSDANYIFYIKPIDITTAVARWGKHKDTLFGVAYQTKLQHTSDNEVAYELGQNTGHYIFDTWGDRQAGGYGSMKVNIGEAYFKVMDMKTGKHQVKTLNFAIDESFARVYVLTDPMTWHGHNRFPFVRITPSRFRENNLPYSSITRQRRGYERVMTALMRLGVRMAASRALIVEAKGLTEHTEKSIESIINEYKQQLASPVPVLVNYGMPDSMKIENLAIDLDKNTKMFEMLMRLSEIQAQVDPSLLGQETNLTAGISLDMKREEALNSFPDLKVCVKDATRAMTERILSLCEEYDDVLHYPAVLSETGEPIPASDGDFTISGNKVLYHVDLQSGSRSIMREQAVNIQAVLQKMDPQISMQFMPVLIEMLQIPDGGIIKGLVIDMLQNAGIALPQALLSEEQAKKQQGMQEEAQRKQDIQFQLGAEDAASQVSLNEAKAAEAMAKAMATLDEIGKEEEKEETDAKSSSDGKDNKKLVETIKKEMQTVFDSLSKANSAGGDNTPKPENKSQGDK